MKVLDSAPKTTLKLAQSSVIRPALWASLREKAMASASVRPLTIATTGSQASPR